MQMNRKPLNRDVIKLIALLLMLGNHIASVFMAPEAPQAILLTDLGYFTTPVMCYFLVEGFYYTHSRKKYGQRLLLFALLSQPPFCLAFYPAHIKLYNYNMIGTLFLCFLMLCVLESSWDGRSKWLVIFLLYYLGCYGDWAVMAQTFVLIFWRLHRLQEERRAGFRDQVSSWSAVVLIVGIMNFLNAYLGNASSKDLLIFLGSMSGPLLAAICILFFYNGEQMARGRIFLKWFNYIFYPAHLLVLGLIRIGLG